MFSTIVGLPVGTSSDAIESILVDPLLRADTAYNWTDVLARASAVRAGKPVVIVPDAETAGKLAEWHSRMVAELHTLAPDDAFQLGGLINLPAKFFGVVRFASDNGPSAAPVLCALALQLADLVRHEMIDGRRKIAESKAHDMRQSHKDRLLTKIAAMGPVGFRRLMRTENQQLREVHWPVIEELINEGLVLLDGNQELVAAAAQSSPK